MFAVFKGTDAQGCSIGLEAHECVEKAQQKTEEGGGGGRGEIQRFLLRGAAFGHWASARNVSWACVTSPESGQKVHLALCGHIENVEEIAELYNVREEWMGEEPPPPCTFTAPDSKLLLDIYWKGFSDAYGDYSAQPETCLASLQGSWSFCLYDESSGYILAAASPHSSPHTALFWASCPATGDISVTTAGLTDLLDRSTVAEFPRGRYFEKSLCNPQGEICSFLPRAVAMDSDEGEQAAICSHVFRVSSGSDISGLHSGAGADVEAQ